MLCAHDGYTVHDSKWQVYKESHIVKWPRPTSLTSATPLLAPQMLPELVLHSRYFYALFPLMNTAHQAHVGFAIFI